MPRTAEAAPPEEKVKPHEVAESYVGSNDKITPAVEAELLAYQLEPDEVEEMAERLHKGKEVPNVAEAADVAPKKAVKEARRAVEESIGVGLDHKMRDAAYDLITEDLKPTDAAQRIEREEIISKLPIEKVYKILVDHGMEDFVEITDREAARTEPYKSMGGDFFIDAGQVLRSHLKDKFEGVQAAFDEAEKKINSTITDTLKKRKDATERFTQALDGADKLRHGDKAGVVDLTAIMQNPEGTIHAVKHLNKMTGKTKEIVAKRTYRDPVSKAYLREVAYAVDIKDPKTGEKKRSDKEVVVEVWNIGRNGGNLLRSSLVKVDTVKDKEWQWKFGQGKLGILPNRHEVDKPVGVNEKKLIRNWFKPQLSEGVRNQLKAVDKSAISASSRTTVDGGDGGGYGVTSHVGRHNAEMLGYGKKKAKKIAKSPGIIEMLGARMFSNSNKMTAKTAKKKH
jgi:hypothetical protein